MTLQELLGWIRANPSAAFILGLFVLSALGLLATLVNNIVRHIVHAIRGVPPQISVKCCCKCHDEHSGEDEDE